MNRKDFLSMLAAAAGGLVVSPGLDSASAREGGRLPRSSLPMRTLGRGGPEVTVLGLGGAHFARAGSERAAQAMAEIALEEGIRFFDTAESYSSGRSERWLGEALRPVRDRVFLMTKTFAYPERTREESKRHLEGSLERLKTDYLDLWQLHSVRSVDDVDRAFAPGASMEYILEMQAQGVVRHVGVTGHARPEANLRALDWFDRGLRFQAMQLPLNPIDWHQESFQRQVLPELIRRGIGVIAMKTTADGRLLRENICSLSECLRYVWGLPVSLIVSGMMNVDEIRENARLARSAQAMPPEQMDALLARIEARKDLGLEWYKEA